MAKNKSAVSTNRANGGEPHTSTTGTGAAGASPASAAPARAPKGGRPHGGVADQVGDTVAGTLRVVHTILPGRLPAYLGAGALLILGVIEPPIALAGGLTYEALRRWNPQPAQRG